jgi:hypothetical protein
MPAWLPRRSGRCRILASRSTTTGRGKTRIPEPPSSIVPTTDAVDLRETKLNVASTAAQLARSPASPSRCRVPTATAQYLLATPMSPLAASPSAAIEASQRHQRAQLRRSLAEDGELISGDRVLIRLEDEHDRADDLPRIRILPMLAAEAKTATDVDLFIVALLDSFGRVLRRRLRDPIGYLESWISIEQPFGDAEKAADGDGDAPETVE